MSTSLCLKAQDPRGTIYTCKLHQTPSEVTKHCLGGGTLGSMIRHHIAMRYFKWLECDRYRDHPGALLDHKLEVLMFISEHPEARFYGA